MMRIIVTQKVEINHDYLERRDALDQRWQEFFYLCALNTIISPNHLGNLKKILEFDDIGGIIFTGGNSLAEYGGDAPERDQIELFLMEYAIDNGLPLLGVCRGMQIIQHFFKNKLEKIQGHVANDHPVLVDGVSENVNSFHNWGTTKASDELNAWAKAPDGIIEGIKHQILPIHGIMWHPERFNEFRRCDIDLFRRIFESGDR